MQASARYSVRKAVWFLGRGIGPAVSMDLMLASLLPPVHSQCWLAITGFVDAASPVCDDIVAGSDPVRS